VSVSRFAPPPPPVQGQGRSKGKQRGGEVEEEEEEEEEMLGNSQLLSRGEFLGNVQPCSLDTHTTLNARLRTLRVPV